MLVAAAGYVVVNLLVDVVYSLLNPRIRVVGAPRMSVRRAVDRRRARRRARGAGGCCASASCAGRWRSPASSSRSAFVARGDLRAAGSRRTRPAATDFNALLAAPVVASTCSAPTSSAATCSRGSSGARARRSRPACSRRCSRWWSRVPIGLVAGYYRGWIDPVIARVTDVLLAFPFLILAVGLAAILGPSLERDDRARRRRGRRGSIRVARGETLALREEDYVRAAVANGAGDRDDHLRGTSSRT